MDALPTHAQLGAALRTAVASARRLGDENNWRAAPGSETAVIWTAAVKTRAPLQLTLTEADVHAVMLVRSALAHADEVGRAISGRRPFLPQSIGRTAVELALRALHLTEESATPAERAERRLNDLLYAITESERQREGYAKKANLSPDEVGDMAHARAEVEQRAAALGLTITNTKNGGRRVSARVRPSTMALAETYLSGSHAGIPEFLVRGHGANIHGIETALLASTTGQFDPTTGITMPNPVLRDPLNLAFELMGVPLSLDNAFRAVASRLEWPAAGKAWRTWDRNRERFLKTWMNAVNAAQEDEV